jgi:hypothetical protein
MALYARLPHGGGVPDKTLQLCRPDQRINEHYLLPSSAEASALRLRNSSTSCCASRTSCAALSTRLTAASVNVSTAVLNTRSATPSGNSSRFVRTKRRTSSIRAATLSTSCFSVRRSACRVRVHVCVAACACVSVRTCAREGEGEIRQ